MRKAALRALPLLVVMWAAFAIMSGSLHTAEGSAGSGEYGAGYALELCAVTIATVSVAISIKTAAGRVPAIAPARRLPPQIGHARAYRPEAYTSPPPLAAPLRVLLQVIRA